MRLSNQFPAWSGIGSEFWNMTLQFFTFFTDTVLKIAILYFFTTVFYVLPFVCLVTGLLKCSEFARQLWGRHCWESESNNGRRVLVFGIFWLWFNDVMFVQILIIYTTHMIFFTWLKWLLWKIKFKQHWHWQKWTLIWRPWHFLDKEWRSSAVRVALL